MTFLLVVEALKEEIAIVDVSFFGMTSIGSGCHVPVRSARNFSRPPLKTLRSKRLPGTPYLGAIPQEVYCHIVQFAEHSFVVHEWTKHPPGFTLGFASGSAGSIA